MDGFAVLTVLVIPANNDPQYRSRISFPSHHRNFRLVYEIAGIEHKVYGQFDLFLLAANVQILVCWPLSTLLPDAQNLRSGVSPTGHFCLWFFRATARFVPSLYNMPKDILISRFDAATNSCF